MSIFFHPTWKADSRFLIRWLYNKHPETFPLRIYSVTCSQVELCPQHASTLMCFRKREIFIWGCITNLRCLLIKNIVVFILATDLISINFIMKMYYNCIFKIVVRKNSRVLLEKKTSRTKDIFWKIWQNLRVAVVTRREWSFCRGTGFCAQLWNKIVKHHIISF